MKVVVTGGSGQLGTLVLNKLAADRRVKKIVALDLRPPAVVASPKLAWTIADVRDPGLERHYEDAQAIVHLAPIAGRIFELAARMNIDPIVHTSSEEVANGVALRPAVLFGRRMSRAVAEALWNGSITAYRESPIAVVWDEDVADAVVLALFGAARGAFDLVADDPLTPRELLRSAALAPPGIRARLSARFQRDPDWLSGLADPGELSNLRAKRELGWKPSFPSSGAVMRRFVEVVPHRPDRRIQSFLRVIDVLARYRDISDIPEDIRRMKMKILIEVTGSRGGDFVFEIAEGRARFVPGIPRPPDAIVSLSADTFLALLAGKDDPTRARLAGRVRLRGEPNGAFAVGGLFTGFRAGLEKGGFEGWSARRLEQWFSR